VSFTPRPLYPRGKTPRYPLDRKLGGPQSLSGRFGEEKILDTTGLELRSYSPARSLIFLLIWIVCVKCLKDVGACLGGLGL
jgi:hypothetical protein